MDTDTARDFVLCRKVSAGLRLCGMKHPPTLRDVMSPNPMAVQLGQPLSDVYTLLQTRPFHHVPVVDGAKPVGMISATDVLKLVYDVDGHDERRLRTFLDHQFTLEDAMSTDLSIATTDEPLSIAVELMESGERHSVLIVDHEGSLAGIVTSTDLIGQLKALL